MCKFFSFISNGYGRYFYFDADLRAKIRSGEIDRTLEPDSHASIAEYFQSIDRLATSEDNCNKYEFNPLTQEFTVDQINTKDDAASAEKWARKLDFSEIVPELVIKEIVHPFEDRCPKRVSAKDKRLLEEWCSVVDSVRDSVWHSVVDSVRDSVWHSVVDSVRDSVWHSVWYSVMGYAGTLFRLEHWKYVDHEPGAYPFQSVAELWERGLVPSFDGTTWRLHGGPDARVMYEITAKELRQETE
jgi:hypothetical protein